VALIGDIRANRQTLDWTMASRRNRSAWNEKKRKRYAEDEEFRERIKAQKRINRAAHKEATSERQRRKGLAKRLANRWLRLRRVYGISKDEYETMVARQGGVCGICKRPPVEPLLVDHCHATGRVRKLLCRKCNTVLGFCRDDHRLLTAAADYLKQAAAKAEAERQAALVLVTPLTVL
jgi:TPR repeat protein